jgi:phosphatidylglycerol:prolipoprotein diacylglycerol transferase
MYPFLPEFLGFRIPLYGLMTALGYASAMWYCVKRRGSVNLGKDEVSDIIFWLIFGAIIGGKLFYIAAYWPEFCASSFIDKLRYGFVFTGGFIGAAISGFFILKKKKLPFLKTADFLAPAVPLGHAIGKIGCFLAGCCYGKAAHSHLAVHFDNPDSLVPLHLHGVGLIPIQLIEAAVYFLLFLTLHFVYKKKKRDGIVIASYALGFSVIRFFAEFFRGEEETYVLGITATQTACLIIAVMSAAFFIRMRYNAETK